MHCNYGQPSSLIGAILWHHWDTSFNSLMMKWKLVAAPPPLPSALCEQGLYQLIWLITIMVMTSIIAWRHMSKLLRLHRRPWTTSSTCWLSSWQNRITPTTTRSSSFLRNSIPSKMSRWWQSFICSARVTSTSYQKFSTTTKLNIQITPTIISFTGWFTILPMLCHQG